MASRCQENKSVLQLVSSVTACYSDSRKPIQWRWIKSGERTQVASLRQGHKWGLLCTCAPLKGHFRAMTETYSRLWVPRESRSVLTGLRSKISNAKYTNEFRTDNYKECRAKGSSRSDWPSRTFCKNPIKHGCHQPPMALRACTVASSTNELTF